MGENECGCISVRWVHVCSHFTSTLTLTSLYSYVYPFKSPFSLYSAHQLNLMAQTGRQQPNMSTTFMGRSRPLDDLWRQTPRSAEPAEQKPEGDWTGWGSETLLFHIIKLIYFILRQLCVYVNNIYSTFSPTPWNYLWYFTSFSMLTLFLKSEPSVLFCLRWISQWVCPKGWKKREILKNTVCVVLSVFVLE